jgi:hypothetical protein
MGRILRTATAEDAPILLNVSTQGPGKVLIRNGGSNDIRVGYDRSDVLLATGNNFFTIEAGITYVFDASQGVGFLSQTASLWFNSTLGASSLEIWIADDRGL